MLIGTRGILTGRLPAVGQFVPFPSWSPTLSQFAAGWHPSGVGTTAPASPGLALTGLVGTVLLGAMGLTQKVLIFACIPIGVWGVVRLLRPFGSQRAALVAGLAYLAMALPYNAWPWVDGGPWWSTPGHPGCWPACSGPRRPPPTGPAAPRRRPARPGPDGAAEFGPTTVHYLDGSSPLLPQRASSSACSRPC